MAREALLRSLSLLLCIKALISCPQRILHIAWLCNLKQALNDLPSTRLSILALEAYVHLPYWNHVWKIIGRQWVKNSCFTN